MKGDARVIEYLNRGLRHEMTAIKDGERRLNGHGRLVIRPSGTEPVIRVMAEGDDKVLVEDVVDGIVAALNRVAA